MKENLTPERIRKEYDEGLKFNQGINLYDCVKTNEDFFIGKQWEGVQSNGLPTPVFNFLKRVVQFAVANVSTDNLKLHAKPLPSSGEASGETMELLTDILNDQFARIFEFNKMGALIREFCRNAAVDGDGCLFSYWDTSMETGCQPGLGRAVQGGIRTEVLKNTQVLFGNPNDRDVQTQPYILIEKRMLLEDAKALAAENGVDPDQITADDKESGDPWLDQLGGEKVTVLTRLWKDRETGTVWACQSARSVLLQKPWDTRIKRYPLAWMNWDFVQDCYHGQAMITGLIPNQIFVNKLFAMSMISLMTLAYPKIVYDRTRISKWSSRVGAAIGVNGSVDGVAKIMDPASVSPQIGQFIELAVSYTQRFLGASDAALGDTRPENTSAIIALQRAAATPMELTKQSLLQAIEDMGRVYMDFMGAYYGTRFVEASLPKQHPLAPLKQKTPDRIVIPFDFNVLQRIPCSVELDVGASSYWSEIASMQTLDNLLRNGHISVVDYLKRLPAGQIADREGLISALQQRENAAAGLLENGGSAAQEINLPGGGPGPIQIPLSLESIGYEGLQRKINKSGEIPKER